MIGVYAIRNLMSGRMYIGKSVNITNRIYKHYNSLNNNGHYNTHLQNSWNKYGNNSFIWGIIEEYSPDKLDEMEKYWIDYYDTYNNGYNEAIPNGINNGRIYDEQAKQIHSEAMKRYQETIPKSKRVKHMEYVKHFRTNFSNPNKQQLKLYDKDLNLIHELNSVECANLLGVTRERLLKSLNKIRKSKGLTYKGYIIIKENETLENFLKVNINNYNKYVVGYNPILENLEG